MTLFNDIFNQDAFQFNSLTAAVQRLPYIESRLGALGLFDGMVQGTETDTVVIDRTDGQIQILTSRQRGAPPQRANKEVKAQSRAIQIPHFSFEDRVLASSLLGKRKPGTNMLQSVAEKVNDRFQYMLASMLAPTLEVHRLNALRGILLDSNGTDVIHNYFQFFGETQITQDFAFGTTTTKVRELCVQVVRQIEDELGGVPYTGIRALCSREFFDALTSHGAVRDTFLYQEGQKLRMDLRHVGFEFGGIVWEEYRGMRGLVNGLGKVADNEAIIFPEGVPAMYRTYYAPGEFLETVNELGQSMYARVAPDWKYNRHVDQLIETNPLLINTRPRAVIKATKS